MSSRQISIFAPWHDAGHGIHWPDLDEDISVEALLNGQRSTEAPASLEQWLSKRQRGT
jgi:hypothetical protein